MLSERNGMKESKENRIEFSDRDPDLWLTVYNFLDPTKSESSKDELFESIISLEDDDITKPADLMAWFDFLGMESLVKNYDEHLADHLKVVYESYYVEYYFWCRFKHLPCPRVQTIMKAAITLDFLFSAFQLSRTNDDIDINTVEDYLKPFLLDDQIGDEVWQFVPSKMDFPDRMVERMDRETIVSSPFFVHIMEMCDRSLRKPKSLDEFLEEIEEASKPNNEKKRKRRV
jgi:hypothetical protein